VKKLALILLIILFVISTRGLEYEDCSIYGNCKSTDIIVNTEVNYSIINSSLFSSLNNYILKNGSTTTTASIPFAQGLSVSSGKPLSFGSNELFDSSGQPEIWWRSGDGLGILFCGGATYPSCSTGPYIGVHPIDNSIFSSSGTININGDVASTGRICDSVSCIGIGDGGWKPNNATESNNYNTTGNVSANTFYGNFVGLGVFELMLFGGGADGNVQINTTTTLTRTMYYNNLTINGTADLATGGYIIYVADTLYLKNYTVSRSAVIRNNGGNGTAASGSSGGTGTGTGAASGDTGGGSSGNNGATGGSGTGPAGSNGANGARVLGEIGSTGGTGGTSGAYSGGAGGNAGTKSTTSIFNTFKLDCLYGATLCSGGTGGGGGGAGGGWNATCLGGGGGGGSGGGGVVQIYAKTIIAEPSTLIMAKGGDGANGGQTTCRPGCNQGGGGAGGPGGGGKVILFYYTQRFATTNINVAAGSPGTGGAKCGGGADGGTGVTASTGHYTLVNLGNQTIVRV
jgi:hypothetical protein